MLISLPDVSSVELISVRLQASMYDIKNAEFRVLDENRGLYVAKIFITPELNAFRIMVKFFFCFLLHRYIIFIIYLVNYFKNYYLMKLMTFKLIANKQ